MVILLNKGINVYHIVQIFRLSRGHTRHLNHLDSLVDWLLEVYQMGALIYGILAF